jgi:hypothetical protein
MAAHRQWASRPADERFKDLSSLRAFTHGRRIGSEEIQTNLKDWRVRPTELAQPDELPDLLAVAGDREIAMNHWSFGQLCRSAGVPSEWSRGWHPNLVAANLNYGLIMNGQPSKVLVNGGLRSVTSPSYGRIWDHEVVDLMMAINEAQGGTWTIPPARAPWNAGATYTDEQLTTLYAGSQDVFIFMVDESRPIEIGKAPNGEPDLLCRGIILWNSEVGRCVFGIMGFLYRYVCANRIIWGAQDIRELRIRHSGRAPERFMEEGLPLLERYVGADLAKTVNVLKRAKALTVGKTDDECMDWLQGRGGYSKQQAALIMSRAEAEEGENRTVWSLVQGATALARTIEYQDQRTDAEEKGSSLLRYAA